MASAAAKLRAYERELQRLIRSSQRIEAGDLARIRAAFTALARETAASMPSEARLTQHTANLILRGLAEKIDDLTRRLDAVLKGGFSAKVELSREMGDLYRATWRPQDYGVADYVGSSPEILGAADEYAARLVGWSHGGLASRMQGQVDSALRLALLDVTSRGETTAKLSAALGLGDGWSWQAERIYRTEVNRFHSLITEGQIQALARRNDVMKRWHWSGISRREHAAIHGQIVPADGFFEVPRRKGGSVEIAFPRAVSDSDGGAVPGDVTVNCGCFHCAVPAEAAGSSIETRPPLASLNPAA